MESKNIVKSTDGKMVSKKENKNLIIFLICFLVIIFDQLTKFIVEKKMTGSVEIIKGFFYFNYVKNNGAAFGILKNQTMLLIWFSVIVIGVIIFLYDKISEKPAKIFTGLILGGTIGNLIDRLRLSYVVDFIDFKIWPAFNIADAAITIGVVGLIIYFIRGK